MAANFLILALSKLNAIPLHLRKNIIFYAPLRDHLNYIGVEPMAFSRNGVASVRWRDTYYRTAPINSPRFEYGLDGEPYGLLLEPAKTNYALRSEDFGNAGAWAKSGITVTSDDTEAWGPTGVSSSERLTATTSDATILQSHTISSAVKTFSIFLRRRTGSGDVQITLDGGSTWTTVDFALASSVNGWTRAVKSQLATNPVIGVRIRVSGDEVWIWGAQLEDNTADVSSYTPTVDVSVTRAIDVITFSVQNFLGDPGGTLIWLQDRVPKVNHVDGVPFNPSNGAWALSVPTHIMEVVKFNIAVSARDIALVQSALAQVVVPISPIIPATSTYVPFSQAVAAGQLSVQINHNIGNAKHKIFPTANWLTRIGWVNKTLNSTTLLFDTEVPAGGGIVEGSVET